MNKATEGELAIQSKRGNTIKKNADAENPAIHVGREGNDVVKRASELEVEEKKGGKAGKKSKSPMPPKKADEGEGEANKEEEGVNGKKRAAEEEAKEGGEEKPKKAPKKTKSATPAAKKAEKPAADANGEAPKKKGPGRPKKGDSAPKAQREKKPRSTEGIGSRTRSRG